MTHKILYFCSLLPLFFATILQAEIKEEQKAFYALSSLHYYFHQALSKPTHKSTINFNKTKIRRLWKRAARSLSSDQVKAIYALYLQAIQRPSEERRTQFQQIYQLISELWLKTHPYQPESKDATIKTSRYLLPENHKLQIILHQIFNWQAIYQHLGAFENAGFETISKRPSGMRVARHDFLPGNLVKIYLTAEKSKPDWTWAVHRCLGASYIRRLIKDKHLKHFDVPEKWIYPLTPLNDPLELDLVNRTEPMLLVVTDMQIAHHEETKVHWKMHASKRLVQELFCLLIHGFSSCCLPSNIPYSQNGKFACIDTEVPQRVLPLHHVGRYLSEEMEKYFNGLVETGGARMPF